MQSPGPSDILPVAAAVFVAIGVIPILREGHHARINLSAWAVITANAWVAAIGNAFADQKGTSSIYLLLNAVLLSPVLFCNLKRGVWGELPPWHKIAAGALPLAMGLGFSFGGEFATWGSVIVSSLLCAQLVETGLRGISREHLATWSWFLLADGSALVFGWRDADASLRVLLAVWVLQCAAVMGIEIRNRIVGARGELRGRRAWDGDKGRERGKSRGLTRPPDRSLARTG